jgi:hypothetical protein
MLKLRRLVQILQQFGIEWHPERGKGGHGMFVKGNMGYPVPGDKEVLICYVKGCRKKFKLTAKDSVPDEQFYGA